jgi:hypothetical protein
VATELESLKQFIVELLAQWDPNLDTSDGGVASNMADQIVSRITPDPLATQTQSFLETRLAQAWGQSAVGEETVLHDILVKSHIFITEPYKRDLAQIKVRQSLANSDLLNTEEVGEITDNMFVVKSDGKRATGIVRLYYKNPRSEYVTPSIEFFTNGGLRYFPLGAYSISVQQMILQMEGGLYYFDIAVAAEEPGIQYNIPAGAGGITGVRGLVGVDHVANKSAIGGGLQADTKEDLLRKAESAFADGSLNTDQGIRKTLYKNFPDLKAILAIGYRDPEMERDILKGSLAGEALFSGTGFIFGNIFIAYDSWMYRDNDGNTYEHKAGDFIDVYYSETLFDLSPGQDAHETFTITKIYVNPGDLSFLAGNIVVAQLDHDPSVTGSKVLPIQQLIPAPYIWRRNMMKITLSDIPGGISNTDLAGNITIVDEEVHIGGHTDIYIRGVNDEDRELRISDLPTSEFICIGDGEDISVQPDLTDESGAARDDQNRLLCSGARLGELGARIGNALWIDSGDNIGLYVILAIEDDPVLNQCTVWVDKDLTVGSSMEVPFRVFDIVKLNLLTIERFILPVDGQYVHSLQTDAGSNIVTTGEVMTAFGVLQGDVIQIDDGPDAGEYVVMAIVIDSTPQSYRKLRLSRAMTAGRFQLPYRIIRREEGVRAPILKFNTLELLNSSKQKTGITVPYGAPVDGRNPRAFAGGSEIRQGTLGLILPDFNKLLDGNVPQGNISFDLRSLVEKVLGPDFEELLDELGTMGDMVRAMMMTVKRALMWDEVPDLGDLRMHTPPQHMPPFEDSSGEDLVFAGEDDWSWDGTPDPEEDNKPYGEPLVYTLVNLLNLFQFYDPTCEGFVFPVAMFDMVPPEHAQLKIVEVCIPKALFDGKNNLFLGMPNVGLGDIARWMESIEPQNRDSVYIHNAPILDPEAEVEKIVELFPGLNKGFAYRMPNLLPSPIFDSRAGDVLRLGSGSAEGSYVVKKVYPIEFNLGGVFENWGNLQGTMPKWWPHVTGQPWPPVWFTPKGYPNKAPGFSQYPESPPYYWSVLFSAYVTNQIIAEVPKEDIELLNWEDGFGVPGTPPYWWNYFGRLPASDPTYIPWEPQTGPDWPDPLTTPWWWPTTDSNVSCRFPSPTELQDDPTLWPIFSQFPPDWWTPNPRATTGDPPEDTKEFLEEYLTGVKAFPGLPAIDFTSLPFVAPKRDMIGTTFVPGGVLSDLFGTARVTPDWPPRFPVPTDKPAWYPSSEDWAYLTSTYDEDTAPAWWDSNLDGTWPGWEAAYGVYVEWFSSTTGRYPFIESFGGAAMEARREVRLQAGIAEVVGVFPGDPPLNWIRDIFISLSEGTFDELIDAITDLIPEPIGPIMQMALHMIADNIDHVWTELSPYIGGVLPTLMAWLMNVVSNSLNVTQGASPGFSILLYNLASMFSVAGIDILADGFTGTVVSGEDGSGALPSTAALLNDTWELIRNVASNLFTPYEVFTPAKGTVRLYFMNPTSFTAFGWSDNPTVFVADNEGEVLFVADPTKEYTLVPGQGAGGEPLKTDLPRKLRVDDPWNGWVNFCDPSIPAPIQLELNTDFDKLDIHEEWTPYGRSYSWMSTMADRWTFWTTDNPEQTTWRNAYRMQLFARQPVMNNVSPVGIKTAMLSNVIQLPSVKAHPVRTGIESSWLSEIVGDINIQPPMLDFTKGNEGDIVVIPTGQDAGAYQIVRMIDPFTAQIDRSMSISTQKELRSFACWLFNADNEGDLYYYRDLTSGAEIKSPAGNYILPLPTTFSPDENDFVFPLSNDDVGKSVTVFGSSQEDIDGTYRILEILSVPKMRFGTDVAKPCVFARIDRDEAFVDTKSKFYWIDSTTGKPYPIPDTDPVEYAQIPPADVENWNEYIPTVRITSVMGHVVLHYAGATAVGKGQYQGVQPARIYRGIPNRYNITGWDKTLDKDLACLHVSSMQEEIGTRVWRGVNQPFRLVRTGIQRTTPAQMNLRAERGLYYFDVDVLAIKGGPLANVPANTRFEPLFGTYQAEGYVIDPEDPNYTFSTREVPILSLPTRILPLGTVDYPTYRVPLYTGNIAVGYTRSPDVEQAQALVSSDSYRITNANQLVRHFLPSYVSLEVTYTGDPRPEALYAKVSDLFMNMYGTDVLELSSVERLLYRLGVTTINRDIQLITLTHDLHRRIVGDRTNTVLGGLFDVPYKGSGRTTFFIPGPNKSGETAVRTPGPAIRFTKVASTR